MGERVQAHPVVRYVIVPHAAFEATRRGIDRAVIQAVLSAPDQRLTVRPGRVVLQSRLGVGMRSYLVRVVVDVDRDPAGVVTVYRTTKLAKYWKDE